MEKPEYYNEFNPDAAAWLRDLIKAGELPEGDVDERSIVDVRPEDLRGYHRAHFFAGLGLWPHALRRANFPDELVCWTGSCPCQPFSSAGKQKGEEDPRHLWPVWNRLIEECRPPIIFGEQVAAAIGKGWLDLVQGDLEAKGYAVGKAVLGAHSVGSPHIRQRLYFVADTGSVVGGSTEQSSSGREDQTLGVEAAADDKRHLTAGVGLADATSDRLIGGTETAEVQRQRSERSGEHPRPEHAGELSGRPEGLRGACGVALGDTDDTGSQGRSLHPECGGELAAGETSVAGFGGCPRGNPHPWAGTRFGQYVGNLLPREESERLRVRHLVGGFWGDASWLWCRDQKYRPVEPSTFPLAHGLPRSMGTMPPDLRRLAEVAGLSDASLKRAKHFRKSSLQGYGNAIVPQVAVEFIQAYMGAVSDYRKASVGGHK